MIITEEIQIQKYANLYHEICSRIVFYRSQMEVINSYSFDEPDPDMNIKKLSSSLVWQKRKKIELMAKMKELFTNEQLIEHFKI